LFNKEPILRQLRFLPYLVLLAGVFIVATSSILIRMAQSGGVPSLAIASWRMVVAILILTPIAWRQQGHELCRLSGKELGWSLASGVFLAAHLGTWIASLEFTSVASSAALVTTYPLWVALVVFLLFGERLSRYTRLGLGAALAGSLLITFSDSEVLKLDPTATQWLQINWQHLTAPADKADTALLGNGLALLGAISGAGYFLVGRTLRAQLSNTAYVWLVYTAAAMVLVSVTLLAGQPLTGYAGPVYLWLILVGVGPQLLGHTAFNWALAYLSATFVVLSILGEPLGSAIFAYFIFGEAFTLLQLAGFALLLMGIGLGVLGEQKL
jgi:drug/metabolite transporter (DMT)-like permease